MRMKHNGRLKVKFDFSFFAVVAFMIFIDTSGAAVLSLIACILHEGGHLLAMAVCGKDNVLRRRNRPVKVGNGEPHGR